MQARNNKNALGFSQFKIASVIIAEDGLPHSHAMKWNPVAS